MKGIIASSTFRMNRRKLGRMHWFQNQKLYCEKRITMSMYLSCSKSRQRFSQREIQCYHRTLVLHSQLGHGLVTSVDDRVYLSTSTYNNFLIGYYQTSTSLNWWLTGNTFHIGIRIFWTYCCNTELLDIKNNLCVMNTKSQNMCSLSKTYIPYSDLDFQTLPSCRHGCQHLRHGGLAECVKRITAHV